MKMAKKQLTSLHAGYDNRRGCRPANIGRGGKEDRKNLLLGQMANCLTAWYGYFRFPTPKYLNGGWQMCAESQKSKFLSRKLTFIEFTTYIISIFKFFQPILQNEALSYLFHFDRYGNPIRLPQRQWGQSKHYSTGYNKLYAGFRGTTCWVKFAVYGLVA